MSRPNQSNVSAEESHVFGRLQGRQGNPSLIINQNANPQKEPERMDLDNLKRYIRSLDGQAVSQFFFHF